MVLMQIGQCQQAYIALEGCPGCAHSRCAVGCYVELFRRMLRTLHPALRLVHVREGLARRPYTRIVLATPARHARPLDGPLLDAWPEARLILHWRGDRRAVRVGALLLVGADGPEPTVPLRAAGWRVVAQPLRMFRRWACRPFPPALPWWRCWNGAPNLLLPKPADVLDVKAEDDDVLHDPLPQDMLPSFCDVSIFPLLPDEAGNDDTEHVNDARLRKPFVKGQGRRNGFSSANDSDILNGHTGANGPALIEVLPIANAQDETIATNSSPSTTTELDDVALAAWLRSAIERARQPQVPHLEPRTALETPAAAVTTATTPSNEAADTDADPARRWPSGPGGLAPCAVEALIRQLTTNPTFTEAPQVSQIGVVKGRLNKQAGLAEDVAGAVMVWLDASGVLTDPYRPEDRWRKPRPLAVTDLDQIAERLRVTPLPDAAAIQAAYAPQD
jgi:hypothetical protein